MLNYNTQNHYYSCNIDRNECKQEAREVQALKITDERMHFDYVWGTMYLPWHFFLDLTLYHVVDIPVLYNHFFSEFKQTESFHLYRQASLYESNDGCDSSPDMCGNIHLTCVLLAGIFFTTNVVTCDASNT